MTIVLASGLIDRYVLENPWPLGVVLAIAAAGFAWKALSSGERKARRIALACAVASAAVFIVGASVTTAAERAEAVVRELVARAERGESSRMLELFADRATMHYGRPENPGTDIDEIRAAAASLEGRYRITSNRITQLDGTSESATSATVLLTCFTDVSAGFGTTPNSWWLRVAQQPDGSWKIERLAFLKVAGRAADGGVWR
ncbi:MAG: hypothetical protein U0572_04670 [Phycisphaerales bacterium]